MAETVYTSNRFPFSNHRRRTRSGGATHDYDSALRATEREVNVQLARILVGSIDPVFAEGLTKVVIEKSGDVCGVCQEEMNVGDEGMKMGCSHKFHPCCIVKWVRQKNSCPLCRFQINNDN